MASTVHIKGAREMEQLLRQLPAAVARQTLVKALRESAEPVLEEARRLATVGTEAKGYGKLKPSLKIVNVPGRLTAHSATVAVTVGKAFWGLFLEFGTRFMSARPFLRPAFEAKKEAALARLGLALGEQIEKAAQRLRRRGLS